MTEDDITDEMVARIGAKLGAPGFGSQPRSGPTRYEAIAGMGRWHVLRVRGERRESIRIVATQQDANALIRQLRADDAREAGH